MPTEDGKLTVGIFISDDAEVLDFCGPFEVLSLAGRLKATGRIRVEATK
jgi:hypothetical protein